MSSNKKARRFTESIDIPGLAQLLYVLIVIIAATCLIYKANYVGTHFDEMTSWQRFSSSVHDARYDYHSTNNHVLNSIFIHFAHELFGGYEQYIRVFPIISGILFFISTAYVIKKVFQNQLLQVTCLLFVCSIRFIFYYLVMARGYGFGLSALMMYIACVFYFINHPISFKYFYIPPLLLSIINFYSIGAMISSAFCMAVVNGVFVFCFSFMVYREQKNKVIPVMLNFFLILIISGLLLYLFYQPILSRILHVSENRYVAGIAASWKGWESFVPFIKRLLIKQVFYGGKRWKWVFRLFLFIAGTGAFLKAFKFITGKSAARRGKSLYEHRHGLFIFSSFIFYFLLLFVYSVILKKSPGLHRNQVFLIPLFVISCFWLIACFLEFIPEKLPLRLLRYLLFIMVITVSLFHPRPCLKSFGRGGIGIARPLLRQLKQLDPDQTWNLVFSKKAMKVRNNFRYYRQFDYKFSIFDPKYNVYVCRPDEQPQGRIYLNYDYFLKNHNMVVVLNYNPDFKKQILEIEPKKP